MKLCDITHFYATKSGGVKTYLLRKVDYISQNSLRDFQHILILPSTESKVETRGNSNFYFISSPEALFWKPYRAIINRRRVKSILLEESPDIVEIGSPYMLPAWIRGFRRTLGYKIVGFYHSHIEVALLSMFDARMKNGNIRKIVRRYIKKTYQDMDLVLTPSRYMERYLNRLGINNTQVIYLGVDVGMFSMDKADPFFRERYGIGKDKTILIFVGRFSKEKRVLGLMDVFDALNRYCFDKYHLILVGGGPEEGRIKNMSVRNTTILPYCSNREELARLYGSSDIFVTASDSETFGLCVLEAQSCGLPVVALESTSIPEVAYKRDFLAKDINGLAGKIELVSRLLCKELRKDTRDFSVRNFSWDKTFQNLFGIYRDLYEGQSHPVRELSPSDARSHHTFVPTWGESSSVLDIADGGKEDSPA